MNYFVYRVLLLILTKRVNSKFRIVRAHKFFEFLRLNSTNGSIACHTVRGRGGGRRFV